MKKKPKKWYDKKEEKAEWKNETEVKGKLSSSVYKINQDVWERVQ